MPACCLVDFRKFLSQSEPARKALLTVVSLNQRQFEAEQVLCADAARCTATAEAFEVGAERWGCEPEVEKRIHKHSIIGHPDDESLG